MGQNALSLPGWNFVKERHIPYVCRNLWLEMHHCDTVNHQSQPPATVPELELLQETILQYEINANQLQDDSDSWKWSIYWMLTVYLHPLILTFTIMRFIYIYICRESILVMHTVINATLHNSLVNAGRIYQTCIRCSGWGCKTVKWNGMT